MRIADKAEFAMAAEVLRQIQWTLEPTESVTMRFEPNIGSFVYTKSADCLFVYTMSVSELNGVVRQVGAVEAAKEVNLCWEQIT
jgi:hypothetical protein